MNFISELLEKCIRAALVVWGAALLWTGSVQADPVIRFDFNDPVQIEDNWGVRGVQFMTPRTNYSICQEESAEDGMVLRINSQSSSGILVTTPDWFNLEDYPVMRWRWRIVKKLQHHGDEPEPDDQAAVIYIGDGSFLRQFSVAYRWEHNIPINQEQNNRYCGMISAHSWCLRNKETPSGQWVVEERNVAEDFKHAYGRTPGRHFLLGIGGNTQYTDSHTVAEIDYIEFLPGPQSLGKNSL